MLKKMQYMKMVGLRAHNHQIPLADYVEPLILASTFHTKHSKEFGFFLLFKN